MALTKAKASNILLTTPAASSNDVTPATTEYVTTALANLVDSAPSTLNTLNELAAALGDDVNFSTTVTNSIATKAPISTTVTLADTQTITGAKNFTNTGLQLPGHMFFNEYSAGRHYIHFKTPEATNQIDWRIQTNNGNNTIHSWYNDKVLFRTPMELTGNITIDSAASAGLVLDRANTTSGSTIDFKTAGTLKWYMGLRGLSNDNFYIRNEIGSTDALTIDGTGKIGIGTTSPAAKLHIEGGSVLVDAYSVGEDAGLFFREGFLTTDQPSITVFDMTNSGASPDGLSINAQDGIRFREDSAEVARFSNKNFGIGTTSPGNKLTVNVATASASADSISVQNTGVSSVGHAVGMRFQYNTAVPSAIRTHLTNTSSGEGHLSLLTSVDGTAGNLVSRVKVHPAGHVSINSTQTATEKTGGLVVVGPIVTQGRYGNGQIGRNQSNGADFSSVSANWATHSSSGVTGSYSGSVRFTVPSAAGTAGNGWGSFCGIIQVSGYSGPAMTASFHGYQNQALYGATSSILSNNGSFSISLGMNGSHGWYIDVDIPSMTHPNAYIQLSHGGTTSSAAIWDLNECFWTWS
jgi:hypothetical protein